MTTTSSMLIKPSSKDSNCVPMRTSACEPLSPCRGAIASSSSIMTIEGVRSIASSKTGRRLASVLPCTELTISGPLT